MTLVIACADLTFPTTKSAGAFRIVADLTGGPRSMLGIAPIASLGLATIWFPAAMGAHFTPTML